MKENVVCCECGVVLTEGTVMPSRYLLTIGAKAMTLDYA